MPTETTRYLQTVPDLGARPRNRDPSMHSFNLHWRRPPRRLDPKLRGRPDGAADMINSGDAAGPEVPKLTT